MECIKLAFVWSASLYNLLRQYQISCWDWNPKVLYGLWNPRARIRPASQTKFTILIPYCAPLDCSARSIFVIAGTWLHMLSARSCVAVIAFHIFAYVLFFIFSFLHLFLLYIFYFQFSFLLLLLFCIFVSAFAFCVFNPLRLHLACVLGFSPPPSTPSIWLLSAKSEQKSEGTTKYEERKRFAVCVYAEKQPRPNKKDFTTTTTTTSEADEK